MGCYGNLCYFVVLPIVAVKHTRYYENWKRQLSSIYYMYMNG